MAQREKVGIRNGLLRFRIRGYSALGRLETLHSCVIPAFSRPGTRTAQGIGRTVNY